MIARVLNKQGLLLLLAAVLYIGAWNRGLNLLYGFVAIALAVWIIGRWSPRLALRGVRATRTAPPSAFEDEPVRFEVEVHNEARTTRRLFDVIDRLPGADGGDHLPSVFVARIRGRSSRRLIYQVPCARRGLHTLGPLRLRSGFPLGFAARERTIPGTETELLVYPAVFPVGRLPFANALHARHFGDEPSAVGGGGLEFFGTREYRPGDSPRAVHWGLSARRGALIVKEFESRHAADLTIVLDVSVESNIGRGRESSFEYAVRIAASVADHALARGHAVRIVAQGSQPLHVPLGGGFPHRARVLDALARVAADGRVPYADVITRASTLLGNGGNALVFLSTVPTRNPGMREAFAALAARRVQPLCVVFDRASFGDLRGWPADRTAAAVLAPDWPMYPVSQGDDLVAAFAQ